MSSKNNLFFLNLVKIVWLMQMIWMTGAAHVSCFSCTSAVYSHFIPHSAIHLFLSLNDARLSTRLILEYSPASRPYRKGEKHFWTKNTCLICVCLCALKMSFFHMQHISTHCFVTDAHHYKLSQTHFAVLQ